MIKRQPVSSVDSSQVMPVVFNQPSIRVKEAARYDPPQLSTSTLVTPFQFKRAEVLGQKNGATLNSTDTYVNTQINLSKRKAKKPTKFEVGKGGTWPKQVFAPFIDMASFVTDSDYSINGAPDLGRITKDTGVKYYNLGFIQSAMMNDELSWGWGGFEVLGPFSPENNQFNGISAAIKAVRDLGGDVAISFGGEGADAIWEMTKDEKVLERIYREVVVGYALTRLDLDIEGKAQGVVENKRNARAIKAVQDETGVDITLTVPVFPEGLHQVQMDVIQTYLEAGVDVKLINIMAMSYGENKLLPDENYGTASLRAVESTMPQIQSLFKRYANKNLTEKQAYAILGTTVAIGFNVTDEPIFTTEWAELVVNQAISVGLGMTSFWSMNRDAQLVENEGINEQYEFTNIFKAFGNNRLILETTESTYDTHATQLSLSTYMHQNLETDSVTTVMIDGCIKINEPGQYQIYCMVINDKGQQTHLASNIMI